MADASRVRVIRVLVEDPPRIIRIITPGPPGPAGGTQSTYLAPGGTIAIPYQEKFDEVVSVSGWKVNGSYDPDGDHTDWLLNVVEKVHTAFNGATVGVLMPYPTFQVSDTISIPYDHINFIGKGMGDAKGSLAETIAGAPTVIKASDDFPTTPGKALIEWQPSLGANRAVMGGGLRHVMLVGGARAARTLAVLSTHYQVWDHIYCIGGTEDIQYLGATDRAATPALGDGACRQGRWTNCIFSNHFPEYAGSTAHAGKLWYGGVGNGAGGLGFNTNRQRFDYCTWLSLENHAFVWGDSDSDEFHSCVFSATPANPEDEAGFAGVDPVTGLVAGIGGLELCSMTQSPRGVARHSMLMGCQIKDLIARACQTGIEEENSPHNLYVFANSDDNKGGDVWVEIPFLLSNEPHLFVYDRSGIRIWGRGKHGLDHFALQGPDTLTFRERQSTPDTVVGYTSLWTESDHSLRIKPTDGIARDVLTTGPISPLRKTRYIPANQMTPLVSAGAAPVTVELPTNKILQVGYAFDQTIREFVQFSTELEKAWNTQAITFKAHWTAASGAGGVDWVLRAMALSDGDPQDTAMGIPKDVGDTLTAVNLEHITGESTNVTPGGPSPILSGDRLIIQVNRDPTSAFDNLTADAILLGVTIFYNVVSLSDD
jgi:hypothetical protein